MIRRARIWPSGRTIRRALWYLSATIISRISPSNTAAARIETGCTYACVQINPTATAPTTTVGAVHDTTPPRPLRERFLERFLRCAAGLYCFGAGIACFVHSDLGVPPWDVFHTGIAELTELQLGTVIIIVGVGLLVLWVPLRIRPGLGTVMNAVQIGLVVNLMDSVLPDSRLLVARIAYLAAGMVFIAFGSGLYIGAELGAGPRDGLMIGLNARFGISIRLARTIVEVTVMITGLALGGAIGIGTFVFAFGIGPMVQVAIGALRMSPSLIDQATEEALET